MGFTGSSVFRWAGIFIILKLINIMAFNPSYQDVKDLYAKGHVYDSDQNESGQYHHFTECTEVVGMTGQQSDGKYGGYGFKSNDGTVTATTKEGVRGIDFPATLLVTSDNVSLVFY